MWSSALWPQGVYPYRDIASYLLTWIDPATIMCLRVACGHKACDLPTHEPAVGLCACGCNTLINHGSVRQLDWFERVVGVNALCDPVSMHAHAIKWLYQRGHLVRNISTTDCELRAWADAKGMCYEPGDTALTRADMEAHVLAHVNGAPHEHDYTNGDAPSWLFETALDMGMLGCVASLSPETISYRVANALVTGPVHTISWWLKRLTCDRWEDFCSIMARVRELDPRMPAKMIDYDLCHITHGIRWCVENDIRVRFDSYKNLPVGYIVANISRLHMQLDEEILCGAANAPILLAMCKRGLVIRTHHIIKMIISNVPACMISQCCDSSPLAAKLGGKRHIMLALQYGNISVLEWLHRGYTRKHGLQPRWYMRYANAVAYEWVRRYFHKQNVAIVGPIMISRLYLELIYKLHRDKIEYTIRSTFRLIESEFIFISQLTSQSAPTLQNHDANPQSRVQVS
jgi:hypothetical protein